MKTKEFIDKINSYDDYMRADIDSANNKIRISNYNVEVATIALYNKNKINISYAPNINDRLFELFFEYAKTPVEEREEEKKYNICVFPKTRDYLQISKINTLPFLGGNSESECMQTEFTLKEIDKLKERQDIPFDWSKIHTEEV